MKKISNISNRLRMALEIKNIKQSDLCKATNISKSNISSYLSGKYEPKSENLSKIAKALDINLKWLVGYDVEMNNFKKSNTNRNDIISISNNKYPFFDNNSDTYLADIDLKSKPDEYIDISYKIMGDLSNKDSIVIIKMNDDGLNRIIPKDSYLIVDTSAKHISDIKTKDIVILNSNNKYLVRKYIHDIKNERFLFNPLSYNECFTSISYDYKSACSLNFIGKVVKYIVNI